MIIVTCNSTIALQFGFGFLLGLSPVCPPTSWMFSTKCLECSNVYYNNKSQDVSWDKVFPVLPQLILNEARAAQVK